MKYSKIKIFADESLKNLEKVVNEFLKDNCLSKLNIIDIKLSHNYKNEWQSFYTVMLVYDEVVHRKPYEKYPENKEEG